MIHYGGYYLARQPTLWKLARSASRIVSFRFYSLVMIVDNSPVTAAYTFAPKELHGFTTCSFVAGIIDAFLRSLDLVL